MRVATVPPEATRRWRPPPARARAQRSPGRGDAVRKLETVARAVLERIPRVIGTCVGASHREPQQYGYLEQSVTVDRAWRFTYLECTIFCVLEDESERIMLGWLVGRPRVSRPSLIERTIIAEAIGRLLGFENAGCFDNLIEEPRVRPSASAWCCPIELRGRDRQSAAVQLFTAAGDSQPPIQTCRPNLRDVPLQLRASLPVLNYALGELTTWQPGTLLRLRRHEHDVAVSLSAGRHRIAIGQLGSVLGERALRLLEVCASTH